MNGHATDDDGANAKGANSDLPSAIRGAKGGSEEGPNSDPMDHDGDDDDDDPVVHEIPVFIAKSLQNNLYLFQVRVPFHFSFDSELSRYLCTRLG